MSYIGNTSTTQSFTPAIDYFSGNGSTTAFTLSRPVASVAQVQVVIDNVAQNPSSAYTVSANTITFTSAPLSGTNNIYVYYTSPITQVIAPSQGTVDATSLASSTGSGAVVLATSPTLVTPALGTPSALVLTNATGLPQAGLGTNVVGNGPVFSAENTTGQSITSTTWTKVTLGSELFDTNNNFSSSRFTATVAGYYQFNGCIRCAGSSLTGIVVSLYKNGSIVGYGNALQSSVAPDNSINVSEIIYLAVNDYVELYGFIIGTSPSFAYAAAGANARFSGALVRTA